MIFSEDLRKRTIEAVINQNMRIKEAVKTFQIGRRTIHTWVKKYKETGITAAKTGYQKGHRRKITDLDLFKKFVEENKVCTATEMAIRWGKQTGNTVSKSTILRTLKKIGFTYKKKLFFTAKQTKKAENSL